MKKPTQLNLFETNTISEITHRNNQYFEELYNICDKHYTVVGLANWFMYKCHFQWSIHSNQNKLFFRLLGKRTIKLTLKTN